MERAQRIVGSLIGLACGDALGTTNEFRRRGEFTPIDDLVGGGPFNLQPGQWTDDTSMALCLAESLTDCDGFDPHDQMRRYLRWYRDGYLSSTGRCFDIGNATRSALERFEVTGDPYAGSSSERTAGNGSLMRLAPIAMRWSSDVRSAVHYAGLSSRTTHAAPQAIDACRYFAAVLVGAMNGVSRDELLDGVYTPEAGFWDVEPLDRRVRAVADGSWRGKTADTVGNSGYVIDSLEAALWGFANFPDFPTGCLAIANLGGDADTNAAIYGQLAGAYYGAEAVPRRWRDKLTMRPTIEALALRLG